MDISKYTTNQGILVAVDCIIFGFDGSELKALLVKRGLEPERNRWSLMGGFVQRDESADAAASRILKMLTGLSQVYMEQLYTFTEVHRDIADRVISIAYFALINIHEYSNQLHQDYEPHWFPLKEIPPLIFDHDKMVQKAQAALREKVANHPIGFELLPPKFTLPQLQSLYEAIYDAPLDKRNFSRKILSLGILNKLDEKEKTSSRKGAFYFVFDKKKYNKLQSESIRFI
jgi:ADP-ribose pyrophosphatase YjhB (NUDIX family)